MNWKRILNILLPMALFLWGSYCMLKSYGYCQEDNVIPIEKEYIFEYPPNFSSISRSVNPYDHKWENPQNKKNQFFIKEWQENYDFHMLHAKRTYEDAKNRVWWLPDISWRQRGREAWVAAFSTVGAQTIQLKLVVAVSSLLCQYGLDCLDEWEYIENKLYWSRYHLEQCAIYADKIYGK